MVRSIIVTAVLLLAWTPFLAADTILLGHDETRVEREPDVAMDDAGGTVVVWSSQVPGGAQPLDCIRLRRIDPEGAVVGEEFRIDPLPGDLARNSSVDITPDGSRFVIAWEGGVCRRRQVHDRLGRKNRRPLRELLRVGPGIRHRRDADHVADSDHSVDLLVDLTTGGGGVVMRRRCSGLADTLRKIIWSEPVASADIIRALAAVDPGSDESVEVFGRLVRSPRSEIQVEAIAGLSAAGPTAVLGNQERLNMLLERGNPTVWRPVEDALAIAETETAACKKAWAPPVPEATPSPPGVEWVPSGGSAMSPRPVGTPPVGGYTGKPKKPD